MVSLQLQSSAPLPPRDRVYPAAPAQCVEEVEVFYSALPFP